MWQQAEWLRGEAASELTSESVAEPLESAANHLECAASAVVELRAVLGCGAAIMSGELVPVSGIDLPGGLVCKNSAATSVITVEGQIISGPDIIDVDVEEWASELDSGVGALSRSVANLKRADSVQVSHGLPQMAQQVHRVALKHACIKGGADKPVGERSTVEVQVQCEQGWPLSMFVEDEAWSDVGLQVKQRVAMRVLGACAVAE
ncbi:unnamed protein product, partial [Symbiodinium sp. KB8]